ncbi:MAG: GNAT family N-acetyltransferase [Promethearchaeota archaeon]
MIIRKLKEEERNAYRKLMRYAFSTNKNNYENMEWPKDSVPIEAFYGAFNNEELIAGSAILPYDIKLRGKFFKMWGVAGVATKPEHRNNRAIRKIFQMKFQDMKHANVSVSVLYPFKFSFYEQLGYYLADECVLYQFKISDIKKENTTYKMKEVEKITDEIKKIYEKSTEKFDYIAKRSELHWKRKEKFNYKFICYDEKTNQPAGYIFLHFPNKDSDLSDQLENRNETIFVQEMFYLDSMAKQTIFNFLGGHRDQFKYIAGAFPKNENIIDILKSPRVILRTIESNSQLRIVNVKQILETIEYPVADFTFIIRVHDEQCAWNNGDFRVISKKGKIKVIFEENPHDNPDLEINIGRLSQLLVGFRTINDLLEFNFAKINCDKKELLQMLFPETNNYFREFF